MAFPTSLTKPFLGLLAFAIVLLYVLGALDLITIPGVLTLALFLALGPLAMVGVLEVGRRLGERGNTLAVRAGMVYGIAAFAIWEVIMVAQAGVRPLFRSHITPQGVEVGLEETVRLIYRGVNTVQATMDVAFDIFYCLAVILFSILMLEHPSFGRGLGILGIVSGVGLLALNLWTFPIPPAEAGLVDLGPVTGVWWLLVIIQLVRSERQRAGAPA